MKKPVLVALGLSASALAVPIVACCGIGVFFVHLWSHTVLFGWDDVAPFIQSHPTLKSQWEWFQADSFEHEVLKANATNGLLQGGSGFSVTCKYDSAAFSGLIAAWEGRDMTTVTWKDRRSGLEHEHIRYEFWTQVADGPESYAVVDSQQAGVVHYYGHAGDGS